MKIFNLFKKISIVALSFVILGAFGGALVSTKVVKGATDETFQNIQVNYLYDAYAKYDYTFPSAKFYANEKAKGVDFNGKINLLYSNGATVKENGADVLKAVKSVKVGELLGLKKCPDDCTTTSNKHKHGWYDANNKLVLANDDTNSLRLNIYNVTLDELNTVTNAVTNPEVKDQSLGMVLGFTKDEKTNKWEDVNKNVINNFAGKILDLQITDTGVNVNETISNLKIGEFMNAYYCSGDKDEETNCNVTAQKHTHSEGWYLQDGKVVSTDEKLKTVYNWLYSLTVNELKTADFGYYFSLVNDSSSFGAIFGYKQCTGASKCPVGTHTHDEGKWYSSKVYVGAIINAISNITFNTRNFSVTDKYVFEASGEYTLRYIHTEGVGNNAVKYTSDYKINVMEESASKVTFKRTKVPTSFDTTVGVVYDAGATVSSPIYHDKDLSRVEFKFEKVIGYDENDSPITTVKAVRTEISENHEITFDEEGTYILTYYVVDDIFNGSDEDHTFEYKYEINVQRTYYNLNVATNSTYSMGVDSPLLIDKNVISFFDTAYGKNFYGNALASLEYEFLVSEPDANGVTGSEDENYRSFTAGELNEGYKFKNDIFDVDYKFKIRISYKTPDGVTYTIPRRSASSGELEPQNENQKEYIEFTVRVVDSVQPIIFKSGDDCLYGANLVESNKNVYAYQAIKGTKITFVKFEAYDAFGIKSGIITDEIAISYAVNGVDKTGAIEGVIDNETAFDYTLSEVGEHIFKFEISDGYNVSNLIIIIDVENEFYSISTDKTFGTNYTTSDVLVANAFNVLNAKGEVVGNATKNYVVLNEKGVEVYKNETLKFTPEHKGTYTVKLTAKVGTTKLDDVVYVITVTDKTAPVITVTDNLVSKSKVGATIPVATFTATDNDWDSGFLLYEAIVTLNGTEINCIDGAFVPEKAGAYIVKLTVTDLDGNKGIYVYEIDVIDDDAGLIKVFGIDVITLIIGGVGAILIIVSFILLLVALGKNKPKKPKKEKKVKEPKTKKEKKFKEPKSKKETPVETATVEEPVQSKPVEEPVKVAKKPVENATVEIIGEVEPNKNGETDKTN